MITGEIKIGSLNCRGLSCDNIKRRDVFHYCRQNYDLIFSIDTHNTEKVEEAGLSSGDKLLNSVHIKVMREG